MCVCGHACVKIIRQNILVAGIDLKVYSSMLSWQLQVVWQIATTVATYVHVYVYFAFITSWNLHSYITGTAFYCMWKQIRDYFCADDIEMPFCKTIKSSDYIRTRIDAGWQ